MQITEADDQWRHPDHVLGRRHGPLRVGRHAGCGNPPALALLADGPVRFDGDEQAYARPMSPLLEALRRLGASVAAQGDTLPFTVQGTARIAKVGPVAVTLDASGSSQFVSALLMVAARLPGGLDLRHVGPPPPGRTSR